MAQDILCCNFLRGKVYLAKRKGNAAFHDIKDESLEWAGNVSGFNISQENETINIPDYTRFSGDACKITRPTNKTVTLTMACFKAKNLSMAFLGEGSFENVAAGSVSDEEHVVAGDTDRIELEYIPSGSIVVTDDDSGSPTTFVAGTDYNVTPFGIEIIEGGGISDGDTLLISYAYSIQTIIEAFTKASQDYYLVLEAVNYGDNDRPVRLEIYNVNFAGSDSVDLIGDEFATFELVGEIKIDDTIPATDPVTGLKKSQEFKYIIGSIPA